MRVIIVCTPRSGSSTLLSSLGKVLSLTTYFEPWNKLYTGQKVDFKSSHLVKTVVSELPDLSILDNYDTIIYLTRKDILEASQSFQYAYDNSVYSDWHNSYFLKPSNVKPKAYDHLKKMTERIMLEDNVVYYEDLYSKNKTTVKKIFEDWGFDKNLATTFYKELNKKSRYRKFKKTIT